YNKNCNCRLTSYYGITKPCALNLRRDIIKLKTTLGIAVLIMMLISTIAVAAATPPGSNISNTDSSGYSTYIVAFKDGPSIQAENSVTDLIHSFNGNIIYHYSVIDGMAVTIPDNKVNELKALDNVKYVEKDQQV